ncbi:hypothetical protein HK107_08775 [Parvularcula sp. ZS-1/3]|uniref:Alpha/beta hydrolase n=1 Tax=Parvularcula mediterranea TaxID=2732508 RepID=A0A7Y3RLR1_9PROT|nr:hypothetical protein [Parvularcula mediterranea]NNU16412.1 hypothetical protein [Parvularcula mediterranea]
MTRIILIHGTFDGDESETGERWWQKGGAMRADLEAAGHQVIAFRWSGENSDSDRVAAGEKLAKKLKPLLAEGEIRIIAHSHGGNVAREAAARLSAKEREALRVVTVGTPFIDRTGNLLSLLLGPHTVIVGVLILIAATVRSLAGDGFAQLLQVPFYIAAGAAALFWPVSIVRRYLRSRVKYAKVADFTVPISHRRDEAVNLLHAVYQAKIAPLNWRSSGSTLEKTLSTFLLIPLFLGTVVFLAYAFTRFLSGPDGPGLIDWAIIPALIIISSVFFFGATFLMLSAVAKIFSIPLGVAMTPVLNGVVDGALTSNALGLGNTSAVQRVSGVPVAGGKVPALPSSVEEAMTSHADKHLGARVGHLRGVLSDMAQKGGDVFGVLDREFTWDELIHTAYFRVPEARAHILEAVGG